MLRLSLFAIAVTAASCGGGTVVSLDGGNDEPSIETVSPGFAPVRGGTRLVITGNGFLYGAAPPNRVLIGGVEAAAAGVIDDNNLEVIVPAAAAAAAGDAQIVVFNQNGRASIDGVFHYSEPPTITNVTPDDLEIEGGPITIQGSGFLDESPGVTTLFLNGERVYDFEIANDGAITMTAPPGILTSKPDISLENDRGTAELPDAFRYVVNGVGRGLLIFPGQLDTTFATFLDPLTLTLTEIPRAANDETAAFRSVARDVNGDLWGVAKTSGVFYSIDFDTQKLTSIGTAGFVAGMVAVGDKLYAYRRCSTFGTIDKATGAFIVVSSNLATCSGGGVAAEAGVIYVLTTNNTQLNTIDPATGALGTAVTLTPALAPFHIGGMAFHNGTLYAAATNSATKASKLISIAPSTGAVTEVLALPRHSGELLDVP